MFKFPRGTMSAWSADRKCIQVINSEMYTIHNSDEEMLYGNTNVFWYLPRMKELTETSAAENWRTIWTNLNERVRFFHRAMDSISI